MRPLLIAAFLTAPILLAQADEALRVNHLRCPPAEAGSDVVVYFRVHAPASGDELQSASSPIADSAELHTGAARMAKMDRMPVQGSASIESDAKHRWPHVMLMHIHRDLKPHDTFPITLHFAHAGDVPATVTTW